MLKEQDAPASVSFHQCNCRGWIIREARPEAGCEAQAASTSLSEATPEWQAGLIPAQPSLALIGCLAWRLIKISSLQHELWTNERPVSWSRDHSTRARTLSQALIGGPRAWE